MLLDLTLQQFCALDYKRNMVVTSGPGAGKTRILSHRFCFILLTDDSVSVPQILTLTFTEKAAEEMKARIYDMLNRLDKEHGSGTDDLIKGRIREAKEEFHRNRISTIHSFCADLLREHPVESGIDPGFSIIKGVRRREIMERSVEAALLSLWREDKEEIMPLFRSLGGRNNLLRALCNVIDHPYNFKRIVQTKEKLFSKEGWVGQVFGEYCRLIKDQCLIPYLDGLRAMNNRKAQSEELIELLETWYGNVEENSKTFGVPGLFRRLRELAGKRSRFSPTLSVSEGMKSLSYVDMVEEYYPDIFQDYPHDTLFAKELDLFLKAAAVCVERYRSAKEEINVLDFADLEDRSHDFLSDFFEKGDQVRLKRIQKRFRYIMVDEFQDTNRVQWDIIRFLCSDNGPEGDEYTLQAGRLFVVGDKRQSIYRFRGGDVTIFESVIEKIRQSNPETPLDMFWQDDSMHDRLIRISKDYPEIKKSHARDFEALPEFEREDILKGSIYLPHNFRTDTRPINFYNRVFKGIFGNKGAEDLMSYETAPRMISVPDEKSQEDTGSVVFYLGRARSEGMGRAEREALILAEVIAGILGKRGRESFEYNAFPDVREMIRNNQPAIGILLFTFTHIKTYEDILREAEIPFMVHRGKGFYRCQEVMDILQILNYITDHGQSISLLAALRSPVFGLTDSEIFDLYYGEKAPLDLLLSSKKPYIREAGSQLGSWKFLSNRLTIAELIRKIVIDRSLTAIHSLHPNGLQRLANIEKLIELARTFQSEERDSLPEFVKNCLKMADEEEEEGEALLTGQESPIRIMTIHAAKGLEFPMVIIPDLDRRIPSGPDTGRPVRLYSAPDGKPGDWNHREGEMPVWKVEVPDLQYLKRYSPLGHLLMRRNRLEDTAENRRVFYVGCTRAKNHLLLVGSLRKGLTGNKRSPLTTGDYRERASILELLNDIFEFNLNFSPEESRFHRNERESPGVIWCEPRPKREKGICYAKMGLDPGDFGTFDQEIERYDLTGPLRTPPYMQLSFKSVRMFKRCPIMFYYNVVLGFKQERKDMEGPPNRDLFNEERPRREDDEMDESSDALFLGSVIHGYLERHNFGDPLDEDLLKKIWDRTGQSHGSERYPKPLLSGPLGKRALDQLRNTVYDNRLNGLLKTETRLAEVPFLFTVSQGIEFRGTIDRLFREKDSGRWAVIDWKSNDLRERDPEEVIEANDYNLQLACYKWAIESILKERVGRCYIYFTDKGIPVESGWKGNLVMEIEEIIGRIRGYGEELAQWVRYTEEIRKDNKECRFCEYRGVICS